jgi:hypothetical protein
VKWSSEQITPGIFAVQPDEEKDFELVLQKWEWE